MVASESPQQQVDRVMTEHGFPPELMPRSVKSVRWEPATGRFELGLAAPVERQIRGIPVHYELKVSGVLEQRRIGSLQGVSARPLIWVRVQGISVDGQELIFEVGPVRKRLPIAAFR